AFQDDWHRGASGGPDVIQAGTSAALPRSSTLRLLTLREIPMETPSNPFFSFRSARLLSLLRIVVAGLFMQHGMAKLLHIPHVASMDNVQLMSLAGVAGMLEIVGGLLLLIGLFTRPVAFFLSGE